MKHLLGVAVVVTLLSGSVAFAQYDNNQGTNPGQNQGEVPTNGQDHHDNGNNPGGQDQGRAQGDNQDHHNNDNSGYDHGRRHHHRHQVCHWYHHHRHCHWTWGY